MQLCFLIDKICFTLPGLVFHCEPQYDVVAISWVEDNAWNTAVLVQRGTATHCRRWGAVFREGDVGGKPPSIQASYFYVLRDRLTLSLIREE